MTNDKQKSFKEFLGEAMEIRGLTIERLSELTGISKRHLSAFIEGDFKKFPPLAYLRGYLMKISEVLRIDGEGTWQAYKDEIIAGMNLDDRLPFNRFAVKPRKIKRIAIAIIFVFVILFLVWRINSLLGIPKMEILNPAGDNLIVREPNFKLSGELGDYRDKLMINSEEIFVSANGQFEKEIELNPGANSIEFKVKRFLGKEVKETRRIIYQP